jgi:DNA-directed RNA polymerase
VRVGDVCINVRVYHSLPKIDKTRSFRALSANSIHSYDASVLFLVIELCKKFNIKVLVIHDSIGCNLIFAPIIKIIFRIANITLLEKSIDIKPFPFNDENLKKNYKIKKKNEQFKNLKKMIIESTNFFS